MIGKTISHYRILEKLGEGGMGVVYKAQDTKLDRIVALKFLPKHLLCDEEAKTRFVHEAKAASALDHQNIATIYEIDEAESQCFISMAYIEGKSVKELIKEKEFSIEEISKIAIQIAEGLSKAHQEGIVHRDIKSDNIMLTKDGLVKIMDFGLAKLKGVTKLTKTGWTLGTLQYMSPEQASREAVDSRSDIFSFGVVLYELITGRLPFQGEHEAAIIYSIMNETPEPLARYKANVPERLQRIVDKALEKDRSTRYQSAAEVIADLKGLQKETVVGVGGKPKRKLFPFIVPASIVFIIVLLFLILKPFKFEMVPEKGAIAKENSLAVMYFENLVDKEDQLLGDMITNLLITDLAESEYVQVVSYQRLYDILRILGKEGLKKIDRSVATQVAKKAGVRNMLSGSISQLGEKKILTSTLVDVASGKVKKSQKVEGTDIYAMVDQLTREVRNDLSLPEEALVERDRPVAELSTKSEDAYRYYLQGLDYENRFLDEEALEKYKKALEYDSTYAMVHYRMLSVYLSLGDTKLAKQSLKKALRDSVNAPEKDRMFIRAGYFWLEESNPVKAEEIYRNIVSRYPDEKEAYALLARIQSGRSEYSAAIELYQKALDVDPNYWWAMQALGWIHVSQYNFSKAETLFKQYVSLRPNDYMGHYALGAVYLDTRDFDRALKEFHLALELRPDHAWSHMAVGYIYILKREYEKAREAFAKIAHPDYPDRISSSKMHFVLTYFFEGKFDKAFETQKEAIEIYKETKNIERQAQRLNQLGRYYYSLGRYDLSLEYFEKAKDLDPDRYNAETSAEIYMIKEKNFSKAQEIWDAEKKRWEEREFPQDMARRENYFKGILEREKGNYKNSIKYFLKARELSKDPNSYGFTLGKVYLLDANFGKAEEEFLKVINYRYRFASPIVYVKSLYYLAQVKEGLSNPKEAISYYQEFLDFWGNADWELPEIKDAKERLKKLRVKSRE